MSTVSSYVICENCGVEALSVKGYDVCPICQDPRQYLSKNGQTWLHPDWFSNHEVQVKKIDEGAYQLWVRPSVGIGHTSYLIRSDPYWILWDPPSFPAASLLLHDLSHLNLNNLQVIASHPHMFGAQSSWAQRYNGTVHINSKDKEWVNKDLFKYQFWHDQLAIGTCASVFRIGGHFPGSSYLLWKNQQTNSEWLFMSDTTQIRPNGHVSFMWSYPNLLPLNIGEVQEMLSLLPACSPVRAFDNFGRVIEGDIYNIIVESASDHIRRLKGVVP